ncbi:hypothetical protein BHE74_00009561 [Ensete ventricosum]|nr:hypothetical protein BHE74_00009561 [Ensete ventricosum]
MGSRPCGKCCCPRAAPRGRAMPPCAGAAPVGAAALIGDSSGRGAAYCGLATGSRPLQPGMPVGDRAWWRLPLQGALAAAGCPLQPAWPWVAGPALWLVAPHLDGEDEGGQASSSIVVSTRWISVAKLLQSDLATLAQRERGE